jgi:hypothetical protein
VVRSIFDFVLFFLRMATIFEISVFTVLYKKGPSDLHTVRNGHADFFLGTLFYYIAEYVYNLLQKNVRLMVLLHGLQLT